MGGDDDPVKVRRLDPAKLDSATGLAIKPEPDPARLSRNPGLDEDKRANRDRRFGILGAVECQPFCKNEFHRNLPLVSASILGLGGIWVLSPQRIFAEGGQIE